MTITLQRRRRFGIVVASFILGCMGWSLLSFLGGGHVRSDVADESRNIDSNIPQRHYSPEEVVARQVQSIRDSLAVPERLRICYSLASPENRATTGPFDRFATMIMKPPYDALATCHDWQVGNASIENEYAAVLVSTVSKNGLPSAFRFLLRLHNELPYEGCWLTEGVLVLDAIPTADANEAKGGESRLD